MASLIKLGLLSLLAYSAFAVPHGTSRKTKTKSSSVSAGPYALGNSTGLYGATGTGTGVHHTKITTSETLIPTTTSTPDEDSPVGADSVGEDSACATSSTVTETAFQTITVSVTAPGTGADVGGQAASSTTAPYSYSNGTTSDILATGGPTRTGYASVSGSSVAHGHSGIHSARSSSRAAASASASAAASSYSSSLSASAAAASSSSAASSSAFSPKIASSLTSSTTSSTSSTAAQAQAVTTTSTTPTSAPAYAATSSDSPPAASSSPASSKSVKVDAAQGSLTASSSVAKSSSVKVDAPQGSSTASTSASATASSTPAYGASTGSGTGKRGLAYNDGKLTTAWPAGQVSWGYNWSPNMNGLNSAFTYVPMLWGTRSVDTGPWKGIANAAVKNGVTHFLGFNEPNNKGQSNMNAQDAANAWRTYLEPYAKQGVKLGAPAIDNGPTGLQWLKDFMSACSDCTIDFVPFHWYDSCTNYAYFKSHISDVYAAGGNRPLWLTEFAGNCDAAGQKTFLQKVMPWLDQNKQIERYSWFMVSDGKLMNGQQMSDLGNTFATFTSATIAKEMR